MKAPAPTRRDRLRAMLADLKMPDALEAVDGILSDADGGTISAAEEPIAPRQRQRPVGQPNIMRVRLSPRLQPQAKPR